MRLEQLRAVVEIVKHGYNVSRAAEALDAPQPAVSRQLRELERELGVDIFLRARQRLRGLTGPGVQIVEVARRILADTRTLAEIARDFQAEESGTLTIATTHTQALYALPPIVRAFAARHPGVEVMIRQGSPQEIVELVRTGGADVCIGSESPRDAGGVALFPCYAMQRIVIAPRDHPLTRSRSVTLETLARYPIITYDSPFIGRSKLVRTFAALGLKPKIVLSAADTDVIKAYVEQGLGIAIVASLAFDPARDRQLRAIDASHLFEPNTIYLGVRRNDYLRNFVFDFIQMFAPNVKRERIDRAIRGGDKAASAR
ncbi:MAG TPA: LysR substrate-binding domain-containing protein [Burkholderiales bacterium]|nr:LysR substrate-binding domain-containing protein [Burkholderiales bacterium]